MKTKKRCFPKSLVNIEDIYSESKTTSLGSHVELTLKISEKSEKKTAIAIDELSMFIATIVNFIDNLSLIWLIFSDETAIENLSK